MLYAARTRVESDLQSGWEFRTEPWGETFTVFGAA
jgi:hypothetical protein